MCGELPENKKSTNLKYEFVLFYVPISSKIKIFLGRVDL